MGGEIVNPFASLASAIQQPQDDQQQAPQAQEQGPSELMQEMGQANFQPPQPVPNIVNLAQAINPRGGQRLNHLESFLGNFVQSLAAGFSTPPGPGAGLRSAGAAMVAPYQRSLQQ